MTETPEHPPCLLTHPQSDRPPAEHGVICRHHYAWYGRALDQIVELYALLPELEDGISGASNQERVSGKDSIHSPAPGRLDIMALTDRRNPLAPMCGPDDVPNVPGTLHAAAAAVCDARQTTDVLDGTVTTSVRVLKRECGWIVQQPDLIEKLAVSLEVVHRALARACGDSMWPRPVGECAVCRGPLFRSSLNDGAVSCRPCRRSWSAAEWLHQRLARAAG